ncbi:MAG: potassium/proton antiporter [Solirubrobacteraceae bacterium]|nr:potassium/proton antiporter [Solirubrobacteraceae bacterium]
MTVGEQVLIVGALLAVAVAASLLAARMRIPAMLLFLAVGMVIGSDVTGWVDFGDYALAKTLGTVGLALILFDGGLQAGWREIRPVVRPALSLAVVGTALTAAITGLVAAPVLGLSLTEGLLVGAVLSSTDGAAIFALLRGSQLQRRLARTLEGESGFNDPIAVLLVLALIEIITVDGTGAADVAWLLVKELALGAAFGLAIGLAARRVLTGLRLPSSGLYPVATLAVAALAFGAPAALGGSGFLAIYLTGLALGDAPIPARRTVGSFHDGLAWVAQVALFVMLGLLVFPGRLDEIVLEGTAIALVLALVARPLAAAAAVAPFGFSAREAFVIGWAGLRGAVPVVLATFVVVGDVPGGQGIFDLVFFAVVLSAVLQGSTVEALARRLGVTSYEPALPQPLTETGTIARLGAEVVEFTVGPGDAIAGLRVLDLGLPREAMVSALVRGDQAIPPRGATVVRPGDELHVLVRRETAREVDALMERWRAGPVGPAARRAPRMPGRAPVFSSWAWSEGMGDPARPREVRGREVLERLRVRWDRPGTLVALDDGRYAVTGARAAIGSRPDIEAWARRRLQVADEDERLWLQTVIAALAAYEPGSGDSA